MRTTVKKWLRDKEYGFLENGSGPDIMVRKADLQNCQFLRVGADVDFDCLPDKNGLIAKRVKLVRQQKNSKSHQQNGQGRQFTFGVMT